MRLRHHFRGLFHRFAIILNDSGRLLIRIRASRRVRDHFHRSCISLSNFHRHLRMPFRQALIHRLFRRLFHLYISLQHFRYRIRRHLILCKQLTSNTRNLYNSLHLFEHVPSLRVTTRNPYMYLRRIGFLMVHQGRLNRSANVLGITHFSMRTRLIRRRLGQISGLHSSHVRIFPFVIRNGSNAICRQFRCPHINRVLFRMRLNRHISNRRP